ncbi:MAG: carbohydrate ABC transporter permease [Clostridiales bacterium]|nr:carbohydrate ABC transporter permease [Clostridiales bacterium]
MANINNKGAVAKDKTEKFVMYVAEILAVILLLMCLLPCLHVLATAFSSGSAEVSGRIGIWPVNFQIEGIKTIINGTFFGRALLNSLCVTALGVVVSMFVTILFAYPMSKKDLRGRKFLTLLCIVSMVFKGGMVPDYLVMKSLKLLNSWWALILPFAMTIFNMLLIKNYFEGLPESVMESSTIDGAGDMRTLFSIVIPMSAPVIATVCLLYAISYWNNYFHVILYITEPSLRTLQVFLRDLLADVGTVMDQLDRSPETAGLVSAGVVTAGVTVLGVVPILAVYPFVQRFLVQGITIGSEKG